MNRPRAIIAFLACCGLIGVWANWRPTSPPLARSCPDGGAFHLQADGVVRCSEGLELPVGQALTLGQKFDCNRASASDFALLPGVGPQLAADLIRARGKGFQTWDEVDAVPGVGAARLAMLQATCEIRLVDGGL